MLEDGQVSLCTVQGLVLMYCCYTIRGHSGAAMVYKALAFELLRELRLDELAIRSLKGNILQSDTLPLKVASRALWGLYCFDR